MLEETEGNTRDQIQVTLHELAGALIQCCPKQLNQIVLSLLPIEPIGQILELEQSRRQI